MQTIVLPEMFPFFIKPLIYHLGVISFFSVQAATTVIALMEKIDKEEERKK